TRWPRDWSSDVCSSDLEPAELLWILGERGLGDYHALPFAETAQSSAFPDAGTYICRDRDLYLLFNTNGNGMNGRGSHGHNDALKIGRASCRERMVASGG